MNNCSICGNKIRHQKPRAKISYGFILIKIVDRKLKVLLIQRRYTISFTSFILGKYRYDDFNQIHDMFCAMTPNEKEIIAKESFNQLWNRIWSYSSVVSKRPSLQKKFKISEKNYNVLLESEPPNNLDFLVKTESRIQNPDWCFPKGRKDHHKNESSLECALREVEEEK
jgi:hypothetical protein